jgi:hypothetical protein
MADQPIPSQEQLSQEFTGPQALWFGYGLLWASGGSVGNPCGFPRYDTGYPWSYWLVRYMLENATLALVRSISTSPIRASYWQYKAADKSVPETRVQFIQNMFDKIRAASMADLIRGRDYGWAGFEPIWDNAGGETHLIELKPLSHEQTSILVDKKGRFSGLSQGPLEKDIKAKSGESETSGLPAPYKAWVYTYDKECGNLHGRSWLKTVYADWKDFQDCRQQLQKIKAQIAGTQLVIKSPERLKDACVNAGKAMSNGAPALWIPSTLENLKGMNPGNDLPTWKAISDLAETSLISMDLLDFAPKAPAIASILDQMRHDEELMFAGGLRPSRTGLEGEHGTKAEAGVHTDTGMLAAELEDDEIAAQMQVMVDAVLELNFGSDAKGSVYIDPPPLVDSKSIRYADFISAISPDRRVSKALAEGVDLQKVMEGLDIPIKEGASFEIQDEPQPTNTPFSQTPINGNGKTKQQISPRVRRALGRISGN